MTLADEVTARRRRDGIDKSTYYICQECDVVTEAYSYVDECPACGWKGELSEASTRERADVVALSHKQPNYNRLLGKVILPNEKHDDIGEILTKARGHYFGGQIARGDQAAAQWLIEFRSVKTDDAGRIYAYNASFGHYKTEGETMLKADLIQAFGPLANRTRVGEILARVQALSYMSYEALEQTIPANLIPLENGIYDLRGGTLLPHSPNNFFTYKHPIRYIPEAKCPVIESYLKGVVGTDRDREILLDIVGLCIYRQRITRNFFVLVGGGHNGKTLFISLVRTFLGKSRVVSLTPQSLSEDVFAPAQLYDKHANLGADIPGGIIKDTAIIKSATGGDAISVQRKGVDRDEKEVYCEFVWASNNPPKISEDTLAIWDRLVVVSFPYTFVEEPKNSSEKKADVEIENRMNTQEELSGLFNLVIQRLPMLLIKKRLSVAIDPRETRREYRSFSDTPAVFVDEACEEIEYIPGDARNSSTGYITAEEAYREYKLWCKANHTSPVSANKFGRDMESLGYTKGKDGQVRSYRGLQIKPQIGQMGQISPILPTYGSKEENRIGESVLSVSFVPPANVNPTLRNPTDILCYVRKNPGCTVLQLYPLIDDSIPNSGLWVEQILSRLSMIGEVFESPSGYWRPK